MDRLLSETAFFSIRSNVPISTVLLAWQILVYPREHHVALEIPLPGPKAHFNEFFGPLLHSGRFPAGRVQANLQVGSRFVPAGMGIRVVAHGRSYDGLCLPSPSPV